MLMMAVPDEDWSEFPRLMKLAEVAAMTTLDKRTIERLSIQGIFPKPLRMGRSRRWLKTDVIAYLDGSQGKS